MSDGFIAKFINSEIMTKGGNAEPLDVTLGKKTDAANAAEGASVISWIKGIFSALNTVRTNTAQGGTSAIKSVQRGTAAATSSTTTAVTRAISITSVNISKSILIVNQQGFYDPIYISSAYNTNYFTLSSTSITQTPYGGSGNTTYFQAFSWQVIEFY